jgi:hypothetical protein
MTTPQRPQGDFIPDEDFVAGLTGFGLLLARDAAVVEALAASAQPGPSLVADDHPVVLMMLGLVALRRAAGSAMAAALSTEPAGPLSPEPPSGDGRGLLR